MDKGGGGRHGSGVDHGQEVPDVPQLHRYASKASGMCRTSIGQHGMAAGALGRMGASPAPTDPPYKEHHVNTAPIEPVPIEPVPIEQRRILATAIPGPRSQVL